MLENLKVGEECQDMEEEAWVLPEIRRKQFRNYRIKKEAKEALRRQQNRRKREVIKKKAKRSKPEAYISHQQDSSDSN